jgi:AcrR family transcriptional regulator
MPRKPNPELQEKLVAIKRQQILEAASAIFAEKGYHRATIKDIATRAGVADGTVYTYFENKTALIQGLLDWLNRSDQRESDFAQLEPTNVETFVRAYTRQRFDFLSQEGLKVFQALLPEILANAELRNLYLEKIIKPTFTTAEQAFAPILATSHLEPDEAKLLLRLEAATFIGLIVLRIIGEPHLEQHWDKVADLSATQLLQNLRPKEQKS